ncbi:MAG: TadE/TadG family type IV pilus assembly protein [Actinomycetota bacterium]
MEFAILASLLFAILFGTIQFGMAFNRSQGLQAAAREGARLAAIGATYDEVVARVQTSESLFDAADLVVTTTPASSGSQRPCQLAGVGASVLVSVTVPASTKYAISIPVWGNQQITYNGTGTFRCERTN